MKKNIKKILLIEDDKFISRAYQDGLRRKGYEVEAAYDGEDGLAKAKGMEPDIILLDLIMPLKNGFEVLEEIKKDKRLEKIPTIVLSNLGQESDIKMAKDLGADNYLVKSNLSMNEMLKMVDAYCNPQE